MDEFLDAIAESLAHAGPEYVTALGLVAIAAWVVAKALPLYASHQDKRLGIEQQREQRKAAEEASREQRDRERSEMCIRDRPCAATSRRSTRPSMPWAAHWHRKDPLSRSGPRRAATPVKAQPACNAQPRGSSK